MAHSITAASLITNFTLFLFFLSAVKMAPKRWDVLHSLLVRSTQNHNERQSCPADSRLLDTRLFCQTGFRGYWERVGGRPQVFFPLWPACPTLIYYQTVTENGWVERAMWRKCTELLPFLVLLSLFLKCQQWERSVYPITRKNHNSLHTLMS